MSRFAILACILMLPGPSSHAQVPDISASRIRFVSPDSVLCGPLEHGPRRLLSVARLLDELPGEALPPGVAVVFFQDLDGSGSFDPLLDRELGRATTSTLWPPGRTEDVVAPLDAAVYDPYQPTWASWDTPDLVLESDESNNIVGGVFPCASDAEFQVAAPDVVLTIDEVVIESFGCEALAVVFGRVSNLGNADTPGSVPVTARIDDGQDTVFVPALRVGQSADFRLELPFSGRQMLVVRGDDDGSASSSGVVIECIEYNQECRVEVDADEAPVSRPATVGPTLRGQNPGDPMAPIVTADFQWELDEGSLRPAGDHFIVTSSRQPDDLQLVALESPLREPRWTSASPRVEGPLNVLFVRVFAADECDRLEP